MSTDLNIKSKDQLIRKIIRDCPANMGELSETQIYDIFEYLVKSRIENPKLKEEVIDFLTSRTSYIPNKLKEPVRDYLVDTARETAIDDFYVYAKLMASSVLPNDFVDGRHIKVICMELQRVYESIDSPKPTRRSMFFLPPGAMKTVLCSIIFPSWVLGKHPNWQVIAVGYNDDYAADKIGDPLKQLMTTPQYKDLFPDTIIRSDSKSKDRFQTTKKGEFKALGAKARAAGRRAHLLLVDDAVSEHDAFSPQKRGEINKNYIGGLRSRLMRTPRGAEVVVNTRWHLADLSGYLLETDKKSKRPWNVICIPAILDDKPTTRIDGVNLTPEQLLRESSDPPTLYTPGTSFWPEFQPMEILEEERESLMVTEPHKWYALYMQNPVAQDGGIVKHTDWKWWDIDDEGNPQVTHVIASIDTAFTDTKRADFSAYTVWGVFYPEKGGPPHLILLAAQKGKWLWPDLVARISDVHKTFKPDFMVIEKKASGQSLLQDLYRKGYPVVEYETKSSKEERLQSASMWFRQGRIWVPMDREWALDLVDEVCNFPAAAHDDLTDTTSQAIVWYRDMSIMEHDEDRRDDEDDEEDIMGSLREPTSTYWGAMLNGR